MARFVTFIVVMAILFVWYRLANRPPKMATGGRVQAPKRLSHKASTNEFWTQVYDTDSGDEARQIQQKFQKQNLECLVYEQGKKDVYGNLLKRYGISVPRASLEKAQALLCESAP